MMWEISVLIVSIAVLILVIFLIPTAIQLRRSARKVEEVSDDLKRYLPDILVNVRDISYSLSGIFSAGRRQAESLGEAVDQIKGVVEDIVGFEQRIKSQVEPPVLETLSTVSAVTKALHTFITVLTNHKAKR